MAQPDRNRTYADPNRNGANQPRPQGWDGRQWQGQNNQPRTTRAVPQRWDNNRNGDWSRNWRQDNRYNWQTYRATNRQVYRLPRYSAPYRDWSYRRLGVGFFLDSLFFGQNYWINDPYMYRLPPAYGPYRWVRYYDDALLVNIYDGEVADVLYDFFW